jgi:outer membrane murein-binding lipoprotein Lpp
VNSRISNSRKRSSVRWRVLICAALLVTALLAGCSSRDNDSVADRGNSGSMNLLSTSESKMSADYDTANSVKVTSTGAAEMPAAAPEEPKYKQESLSDEAAVSEMDTTSSIGTGAVEFGAYDRKLIYNANVALEVADYGKAQTELFNMVTLAGGYMLNFNDMQTQYELGGVFVIKIPSQGFHPFVNKLEALKKKDTTAQRSIQGKDVTEEYVDIESRLKAKQVVEGRLLSFMEKAADTKNLLQFSNELARVQEEIEAIKGRMRYIDQNVAFSTVELRMYEKNASVQLQENKNNVLARAGEAMKASGQALLAMFEGIFIVLAGALPILLVTAVIVMLIWTLYRKTRYAGPRKSESPYVTSVMEEHTAVQQTDNDIKASKDERSDSNNKLE